MLAAAWPPVRPILAIAVAAAACTGEIDMPAGEVPGGDEPDEMAKHVDIEGPAVLGHV